MSSVVIKSIDRKQVEQAVNDHIDHLRAHHLEIQKIIWFGSWINGIPGPGSDVDLCLILCESEKPFRERIPDYLPSSFPVGVDVFPYTVSELEKIQLMHPGWYREMISGKEM